MRAELIAVGDEKARARRAATENAALQRAVAVKVRRRGEVVGCELG